MRRLRTALPACILLPVLAAAPACAQAVRPFSAYDPVRVDAVLAAQRQAHVQHVAYRVQRIAAAALRLAQQLLSGILARQRGGRGRSARPQLVALLGRRRPRIAHEVAVGVESAREVAQATRVELAVLRHE